MIHLDRTSVSITQRCTLCCKLCNAYIPHYKNPRDMPFEVIKKVLDRYFQIVTSVGIFGVLGGEPLLHKDLSKILNYIALYDKQIMERIDLVTNGTLDMDEEALDFFVSNSPKAKVIISHYGERSPKADDLAGKLMRVGANFRVAKYYGNDMLYDGWLDFSDHTQKHFTSDAIEEQSRGCIVSQGRYYLISEGEMHTCTRSHWRMRQGIIPRNPVEYLDLLDDTATIQEQREILEKLEKRKSVTSCAYCAGSSNERVRFTPAEQLPREMAE